MQVAICERPDHPGFGGTEFKLACMSLFADSWKILEYPFQFGRGEIAVQQQTCFLAQPVRVHAWSERLTNRFSPGILPDDGWRHRLSRILIPKNKCFTLVIEPHRGDIVCGEQRRASLLYRSNNIEWFLFDPPGLRETRRQLRGILRHHFATFVDNDRCGLGCALINAEQILHLSSQKTRHPTAGMPRSIH